ncbi:MAG: nucleotide-binding protein [Saprospiraceae bacterium]|nr:nucleotide-binding protein [Saprospiraceae bacterium]
MRPKILIFSAEEGKGIANAIQGVLEGDIQVVIWDDAMLAENPKGYLGSLLLHVPEFGFAIIVLTPADCNIKRQSLGASTREDLVFEIGLALGLLGSDRILVAGEALSKDTNNLKGIKNVVFETAVNHENYFNNIHNACNQIRNYIKQQENKQDLKLLPSFALAVGYFQNFILRICKPLNYAEKIKINIDNKEAFLEDFSFRLTILIPHYSEFHNTDNLRIFEKKQKFHKVTIFADNETFYNIKVKDTSFLLGEKDIQLYDIPNNLTTSGQAINFFLQRKPDATPDKQNLLLQSEVEYFGQTLQYLLALDEYRWLRNIVSVETSLTD